MAAFELRGFRGERPIVDDGDLNENEASYALDLKIEGGKLVCMREPLSRHTQTVSGSIQSFARYAGDWFEWNVEVDVSPSQVGGDTYDRRIFTGDGAPKVTYNAIAVDGLGGPYPSDAYLLGVPPPGYVDPTYRSGQAASIALVGTATTPSDPAETRFYVLTSIDVFGAEGPPTPISNSVDWRDGQSVDVTIPAAPVGDYNITGWRMYRTATGTDGTDFQYVKDGTTWSTTVNDAVATEALGEVLSTEFYALPNANMVGIEPMPNGYLAGFSENTVYFSEPGYPHAWPISYQQNTKAPIVGLKAMGNNMLLVTTEEHPYVVTGNDPASAVMDELEDITQACVSKRSLLDVGPGVVYASPDGLVLVTASGADLITRGLFSRDQWQALEPSTMQCYLWENLCLVFYGSGATQGFALNPTAPEGGIIRVTGSVTAGLHVPLDDTLYLAVGSEIVEWDGDTTYRTGVWKSKQVEFGSPRRVSAARAWSNGTGTLTIEGEDEGASVFTAIPINEAPFRVNDANKHRQLTFKLTLEEGRTTHRIVLAESMVDLRTR